MENYKEKYECALEAIQEILSSDSDSIMMSRLKLKLQSVFPELKESEDERIRKMLIRIYKKADIMGGEIFGEGITYKQVIAWLEKQGGQKLTPKFKIGDTIHRIRENTVFPMTIEKIEDGDYVCNNSHSFLNIKFQDDYELVEQKPTDKVEPKFKVGDWIVNNGDSYLIADIDYLDNRYLFEIGGYTHEQQNWEYIKNADEYYHLWTIQDAKDGDVLLFESYYNSPLFEGYYNSIVLFQGIGINGEKRINYHCKCDLRNNSFGIQGNAAYLGTIDKNAKDYHPATEEQRDLLFQKMKEAGYEWSDKDRKLIKME